MKPNSAFLKSAWKFARSTHCGSLADRSLSREMDRPTDLRCCDAWVAPARVAVHRQRDRRCRADRQGYYHRSDNPRDLSLGLDLAALIVAIFATMGATMGIGAGVVVGRLGVRRSRIGGMGAIAVGNVIGAGASDELVLLAARTIEGVGFFGVVLAIPSMLTQLVPRDARDFVMAVWSAYMPTES
jgi:Major Facilitator Superfamily